MKKKKNASDYSPKKVATKSRKNIGPIAEFLEKKGENYLKQSTLFTLIWNRDKRQLTRFVKTCSLDELVQCFEDLD